MQKATMRDTNTAKRRADLRAHFLPVKIGRAISLLAKVAILAGWVAIIYLILFI